MVFLGSEKQAAARALCLQQLMKRKPAISLQHSQHLGREQSYLHPQHWEQQLGTTRDQSRGSGPAQYGEVHTGGTEGPRPSASRDGSCHLPAVQSLLAPAGGEADMLQLRLIK